MKFTESKRVYLINVTCGFGSTGRIVTGIYDELRSRGYECRIAYGRGNAPSDCSSYRIGNELGVNIHGILSRITDRQGLYSSSATRKLISDIKAFEPSIVHLHNIHGYYLNYEMLFRFLKDYGAKVIWTLHDCWSFTGHCTHFEYIGCNKWQESCSNCEQLREYPKSLVMDSSASNYKKKKALFTDMPNMTLVTPSEWLKGKVEQSYMGKYPVKVVPTGINLDTFRPYDSDIRSQYGIGDRFLVLGAANPWRDRKGLGEFIKLSQVLSDRYKIVLIGLKPQQMKLLPPEIIGLSRTDSVKEMAMWYSTADAYVNLTLEDTFPTTNIEALACGTPVVTYKAGGSPESVIDGECGFTVARSSISGVAAALDMIRTGSNMSEACRRRAQEYASEIRFAQYYEDVYQTL